MTSAPNIRDSRAISFRIRQGNDRCADCQDCDCERCGFPDPVWVSQTFGIIVCEECKSLHETITKAEFKSILSTHEWTEDDWTILEDTSNLAVNEIFEAKVPAGYQKPTRCFDRAFREHWLKSKYVKQHFKVTGQEKNRTLKLPAFLQIGKKTGYLWKRGRDDNMFQRRWFAFEGHSLAYYTEPNKTNQRREISLKNVHVCVAPESKIHHPNGLQFIIDEGRDVRMIYLYAEQEKDMIEWYQSICIFKYWVARHCAISANKTVNDSEILQNLNTKVIMEGPLLKTDSTGRKAFRKRWFILHGKSLMYFSNPLDANPLKTVKLRSHKDGFSLIMTGDYHPEWPKDGFHFLLKTPGRIYTFIADSDHERQAWYKALFMACNTRQYKYSEKPKPPKRLDEPLPPTPLQQQKQALGSLPKIPVKTSSPESDRSSIPPRDPPSPVASPQHGVQAPTTSSPQDTIQQNNPPLQTSSEDRSISESPTVEDCPVYQPSSSIVSPPPTFPCPESGYLTPFRRAVAAGHGVGHDSGVSTEADSDEDDYEDFDNLTIDSDDGYVRVDTVPVICAKVDSTGYCVKSHGFCLRIPEDALEVAQGEKCFISVTPRLIPCPDAATDQSGINAHGAHVVECKSFNYLLPLKKPMQLEIPHCAIVGNLNECEVKIWHKHPSAEDNSRCWRELLAGNEALSCQVKQRCLEITTLHMGSFAFLLDGSGVTGKTMQMAIFTRPNSEMTHVSAHVYIFNNISSDTVWMDIEEKEIHTGSVQSDVSTSFTVHRGDSKLELSLHDIEDLALMPDQPDTVNITPAELWQNPFVKIKVKFEVMAKTGKAKFTLHHGDGAHKDATFNYNEEEYGPYYSTLKDNMYCEGQLMPSNPKSRASLVAGEDPYMFLDDYPLPSRHTSERREAQRRQSLRYQQAALILRSRRTPFARSTPRRFRRGGSQGETSSSTTSETCSESSGQTVNFFIPQRLKKDLGLLLDGLAEYGNDWSMLAKYVGLEHLMHRFLVSPHPTAAVLSCCQNYNLSLEYLEQAMRDIDREDAASLIKSYITRTKTTSD